MLRIVISILFKLNEYMKKKLVIIRRFFQILFFSLFVYILWSTTYPLQGVFSPQILFKVDPLIMITTALSERAWLAGLGISISMLLLTLIFGRFFCGWICPLGTVMDGIGCLTKRKRKLPDSQNRKLFFVKYCLLAFVGILALIGIQAAWIFDPIVIISRVISLNIIPMLTWFIDKIFIFLIQKFEWYGSFYDLYRQMKVSFLGINVHFFSNSLAALILMIICVLPAIVFSRLWCRVPFAP